MIVDQLEEKIKILTTNYTNLELDLDSCQSSKKDLIQAHTRSQQETKDYTKELEDKNLKCRTANVDNRELILGLKKNQTELSFELDTCKNTDTQRELWDLQSQLKDVNERKQVLQEKYELVCPWTAWSSCSQTCWGTKTRTDTCSSSDEQIKACNQFSSCLRSGK